MKKILKKSETKTLVLISVIFMPINGHICARFDFEIDSPFMSFIHKLKTSKRIYIKNTISNEASLMQRLHQEFPLYDWKNNKGYPTKFHRQCIVNYGTTKYHRKSFKLLPLQLKPSI